MSSITPTIGRKVWYYSGGTAGVQDEKQAFDASVVYVHGPTCVNLSFFDHGGNLHMASSVSLTDPQEHDSHNNGRYATWMPYQVGQAKATPTT